jgi:hypothetical protein
MKKDYLLEAKRMQKLAGIASISLNEKESTGEIPDSEIDAAMKAALNKLKDDSSLEELPANQTKQDLNESAAATIIGGLLAAPTVISWIGSAVNYMVSPFSGKDESTAGEAIKRFAHKWEGFYLFIIKGVVKKIGFVKPLWTNKDGKVEKEKLDYVCKFLYALIIAVAMGYAIKGALHASSAVMQALETSLGGVKAAELASLAVKLKKEIGILTSAA